MNYNELDMAENNLVFCSSYNAPTPIRNLQKEVQGWKKYDFLA